MKAVIFDMDGLLIDSEAMSFSLYQDLIRPYGGTMTKGEYARTYLGRLLEVNMKDVIDTYHLPLTIEQAVEQFGKGYEEKRSLQVLKPGAMELLDYLKKRSMKAILATSSTNERAIDILKMNHVQDYFDEIVAASDVHRGKPDPEVFLVAQERAGVSKEECLVLEDSEAGIQAAHAAKIKVICIPDLREPRPEYKEMTEAVLPSLNEVIDYLEKTK